MNDDTGRAVVDDGSTGAASFADRLRFALRGVGQVMITAGLVLLLFVVYEVYVTNFVAARAQSRVHHALQAEWVKGRDVLSLPQSRLNRLDGHGIANLYIPRFGKDYAWTIVEGTSDADLAKGPGHYAGSQLPGRLGDFAIAGHRVGKGEPFLNLDKLTAGDPVIVETERDWFVYCVIGVRSPGRPCDPHAAGELSAPDANGVPGREIVDPSDGAAIAAVPDHPTATGPYPAAYLTMTTCHPKFTANERMVVHAVLAETVRKAGQGAPIPAAVKALYDREGGD